MKRCPTEPVAPRTPAIDLSVSSSAYSTIAILYAHTALLGWEVAIVACETLNIHFAIVVFLQLPY